MKTNKKTQSVSVKSDSLNRGCNENLVPVYREDVKSEESFSHFLKRNSKKYNLFCLKSNSIQPNAIEISEQLNDCAFSRRDVFDYFFGSILPNFSRNFSIFKPCDFLVSIDKGFFSPFNNFLNYRRYAFRLGYVKEIYPYLSDKIIVSRVQFYFDDERFTYIFFVKEVSNVSSCL